MRSRSGWVLVGLAVVLGFPPARLGAGPAEGFELSFGGSFVVGQPLGEFADQVGTAYGLGGHLAWGRPGWRPWGSGLSW